MKTFIQILTAQPSVRKASAAFVTTLLTGFGTSMADGNLTTPEVVVALGATLVATAAVWRTDNVEEV